MNQEVNKETTENNQPPYPSSGKNKTWIWIGIIALLLGVNIYLFSTKNKIANERDQMTLLKDSLNTERDHLSSEYDAAISRLDMLLTKNTRLDSLLGSRDSEISLLKNQIQGILSDKQASAEDLTKARRLIETLREKVKSYEERIAILEQENATLSGMNRLLADERDSTVADNIALQQKVRLGRVLHISNIRMTPIELKRSGKKEKATEKARKVDMLRIQFDIDENRVADDGIKELFLCITDPQGNLLSNAAYGSGVTQTYDGRTLQYTLSKQIELKQGQPVKDVIVDWYQESDYKRGDYQIVLYHDGYAVGTGNVNLR